MDGGIADSVPIDRALLKGNEKLVVILTRNPGYRKAPLKKGVTNLYRRSYKKYPKLVETLRRRYQVYNCEMEKIEKLEEEGKIFVLRPQIRTVARLEKDKSYIDSIIKENAEKASYFANKTLRKVQRKVGFPDRIR